LTLENKFKKAPSEIQFKEIKLLYSRKSLNGLRIPSRIFTRHWYILTVTKNHMSDKIWSA